MKIFSGSSNKLLVKSISDYIDIPISQSELARFGNSEIRVRIIDEVKGKTCVIIQSTSNPTDTHCMELFFYADALKRQEAQKIIGFIPYFGYARQDRQHRKGECVSSTIIIRILETLGFYKIYTIDLHDEATEGVFSIPFKNISALEILAHTVYKDICTKDESKIDSKTIAILAPDQGAIEKARKFGSYFFGNDNFPLCVVEKKRDQNHIHKASPYDLYGDVSNKFVIIVDDIITSGSTLFPVIDLAYEKGAKKVFAAIVHHDFSDQTPLKIQNSRLERLYTTDTIKCEKHDQIAKMTIVSVAELIAKELKTII